MPNIIANTRIIAIVFLNFFITFLHIKHIFK